MPVTDQYRRELLDAFGAATSPSARKTLEAELAHQRKMDDSFLATERATLAVAGLIVVAVCVAGIVMAAGGHLGAAALTLCGDAIGMAGLMIRRSYFIPQS